MADHEKASSALGGEGNSGKMALGTEELKQILASVGEAKDARLAEALKLLAENLLESRKPYRDPKQEENARVMRRNMQIAAQRQQEQLQRDQEACPHIMGSNALSDAPDPANRTSIVQHILDTGEVIGICTNCTRVWRQGDKDYIQWMSRKSANRRSAAGRRMFANPLAAIEAGQGKHSGENIVVAA